MEFEYSLEKGSKKHRCPQCNKKTFVRYVNNQTGQYCESNLGRCDREQKCGYHTKPEKQFQSNQISRTKPLQPKNVQPAFIPESILNRTQKDHTENRFLNNLKSIFNSNEVETVRSIYQVGTIAKGHKKGAVTFPFIDHKGRISAIQVKQFDSNNHTTKTGFIHSMIEHHNKRKNNPQPYWLEKYLSQDRKINCLFGAHLLIEYPNNPVALVEAPKTAIYSTLYFGSPAESANNLLWLATYNKSSFKRYKCEILKGRHVAVFPDLGAFDDWQQKANEIFSHPKLSGTTYRVSDLLERGASKADKAKGLDLADYLQRIIHKVSNAKSDKSAKSEPSKTKNIFRFNPLELLPEKDNYSISEVCKVFMNTDLTQNEVINLVESIIENKQLLPIPNGNYYKAGSTPF